MTIEVDRARVLAYRASVQGFERKITEVSRLPALDLGVQDTPAGSARLALAARLLTPAGEDLTEGGALSLVWSVRGAPHLHRSEALPGIARALWPLTEEDARARLTGAGNGLKAAGFPARQAFEEAARAFAGVVTRPLTKGEVSAAVTARVPEPLAHWCPGCGARHIYDQLLRMVALPGGGRLEPETAPLTFAPIAGWPGVPESPRGTGSLVESYLRLLGPATPQEVAAWLGTTPAALREAWPRGLVEVRVDGRRTWLPEAAVPALRDARRARIVRLLPPSDPYLQARDRALLLPDKAQRAALWRGLLARTGAVLANGEIEGVWQARKAGRARLEVTVEAFRTLPARTRAAIEVEAERLAAARELPRAAVSFAPA